MIMILLLLIIIITMMIIIQIVIIIMLPESACRLDGLWPVAMVPVVRAHRFVPDVK